MFTDTFPVVKWRNSISNETAQATWQKSLFFSQISISSVQEHAGRGAVFDEEFRFSSTARSCWDGISGRTEGDFARLTVWNATKVDDQAISLMTMHENRRWLCRILFLLLNQCSSAYKDSRTSIIGILNKNNRQKPVSTSFRGVLVRNQHASTWIEHNFKNFLPESVIHLWTKGSQDTRISSFSGEFMALTVVKFNWTLRDPRDLARLF